MPVPLFGWSAGDVVSAARALYKIGQAFSETQGAATQYAEASKVLEYLAKDRQRAQELIESRPTSKYTPDVRAKLELVDAAYKVFEQHQEDYKELEAALLATSNKRRDLLKKQSKKIKWAVEHMTGRLQVLKDAVAEPLGCINASYLHLILEEMAALRQATAQQRIDLRSLELSLGLESEQQRKELVTAGATLTHLLERLDEQQLDLTTQLVALQLALDHIKEQTDTITISQDLAAAISDSTANTEYHPDLIRTEIESNTNQLWEELMRSHETHQANAEIILEIVKKLSQLEIDLELLEVRGRRVETFAMISASSAIALLALNILTVLKVRSINDALQKTEAAPASYSSSRPNSAKWPVVEAVDPTVDIMSKLKAEDPNTKSVSTEESSAAMADAWTRFNRPTITTVNSLMKAPLDAFDKTEPTASRVASRDGSAHIESTISDIDAFPKTFAGAEVGGSQGRVAEKWAMRYSIPGDESSIYSLPTEDSLNHPRHGDGGTTVRIPEPQFNYDARSSESVNVIDDTSTRAQVARERQSVILTSDSKLPPRTNIDADAQRAEDVELLSLVQVDDHWAVSVFTDMSVTTLEPSGDEAECHGESMPDAIAWLNKDKMQQLLKIGFGRCALYVYLFIRESDCRARILCETPVGSGTCWYSCMPFNRIYLRRSRSMVTLHCRVPNTNTFTLWASLPFTSMERLVLFYNTCLTLRSNDTHKSVTNIGDHELSGEICSFGGEICNDNYRHALRIYRDRYSRAIRLQASVMVGDLKNTPIWTAFITDNILLQDWMRLEGRSVVCLRSLKRHVFSLRYNPPKRKGGEHVLEFCTSSDARDFMESVRELAEAYRK